MVSARYARAAVQMAPGPALHCNFPGASVQKARDKRGPFEMPGDFRVGQVEPDAMPGPIPVNGGFEENETAADAFPARSGKGPARSGDSPGRTPVSGRRDEREGRGRTSSSSETRARAAPVLAASRSASLSFALRRQQPHASRHGFLRARESRGLRAASRRIPFRSFPSGSREDAREIHCLRRLSIRGNLPHQLVSSSWNEDPPAGRPVRIRRYLPPDQLTECTVDLHELAEGAFLHDLSGACMT